VKNRSTCCYDVKQSFYSSVLFRPHFFVRAKQKTFLCIVVVLVKNCSTLQPRVFWILKDRCRPPSLLLFWQCFVQVLSH